MHTKRWIAGGLGTVGLGAAVLQVASASVVPATPSNAKIFLEWTGICVIAIGTGAATWPFIPSLPHVDYLPRRAKRGDLKLIFELCEREFDGEVSSLSKMKDWFNHNPNIFWIVEKVKRKAGIKISEMCGYFSIIPLNKSAAQLVLQENLQGTEFTTEHMCKPNELATAYYIGGIAATGWRAKGAALSFLKVKVTELEESRRAGGKPVPFVTRPITTRGLGLMAKYDFEPVGRDVKDPLGRVHSRDNA